MYSTGAESDVEWNVEPSQSAGARDRDPLVVPLQLDLSRRAQKERWYHRQDEEERTELL